MLKVAEKKYPDYSEGRYTSIKLRKNLMVYMDLWIEKHKEELALMNLDNRAGAFQYILIKVLEAEGLLPEFVPVPWDKED